VFENRELGRILETKEDEIIAERRKLNNVELHNLYSSPNIIKIIKLRSSRMHVRGVRTGFW
jgi:hypothetical protein